MRKLKLTALTSCWVLTLACAFATEAALHRRMNSGQVYQLVEKYRLAAQKADSEKARRKALRPLKKLLEREIKLGLKFNDEAHLLANRVLVQVEYILENNCGKAKDLLISGTGGGFWRTQQPRSREVREGLYLYQSVCR